ncbi:MAG: SLATT domain-containing protein [Blastocatellia bacterium]
MQYREKLKYLEDQITQSIIRLNSKADRNRNKSFAVSMASAILGALVTIALGVKIASWEDRLKDVALICGALIAVVNSARTIFSHRELWIKQKNTQLELYTLRNEIDFYKAGLEDADQISEEKLSAFFEKYQTIWATSSEKWLQLRKEQKQEELSKR